MFSKYILNPLRRALLPKCDIHIQIFHGPNLNGAIRARIRLLNPAGNSVPAEVAGQFDALALESPANQTLVPAGGASVLLPPPVYELAERATKPRLELPKRFLLTVFNPYSEIKGADEISAWIDRSSLPLPWCHSQATMPHEIPLSLSRHPRIIHVEDATEQELRYLYETCAGYVCFSKYEGFGWTIVDALRYTPAIYSRPVGVLSFPESSAHASCQGLNETLDLAADCFSGGGAERVPVEPRFLSPNQF